VIYSKQKILLKSNIKVIRKLLTIKYVGLQCVVGVQN